jgi:type IV pilus assembly protein PilB
VTGPTGSGKSTTLFGLLDLLNKEGVNISTLEDPVEYQMKGISQSQIRPEIGYTFATGLRSFLRQDPDIIMVGEIRDQETGELSIHAALTGHLVLSTIHTTSALGAIARMVDMKVEMFLLGSTLNTIIAQRLVRKICPKCKDETEVFSEQKKALMEELAEVPPDYIKEMIPDLSWDNLKLYKGKGCPSCGNTGYTGRLCIAEVVDINEHLKRLILDGKMISKEDVRKHQVFTSMKQDGFIKVILGQTSMEEVLRVMRD